MIKYRAVKGVKDILPSDIGKWHELETKAKKYFDRYGFNEIRLPIFEKTSVFSRSLGDTTDIVEKEMYTFTDRGGESLTLRPEGTASVVRAFVEHQLHISSSLKRLYYLGPMFRRERPQAGRYRQFYQIGAEVFGSNHPEIDAETIAMLIECMKSLRLKNITLNLNSLGCAECRPSFRGALTTFIQEKISSFCDDCRSRFERNPLRVLDCKAQTCKEATVDAPTIPEHLCDACIDHFDSVKSCLERLKIEFIFNPKLVRGLDYYTRTTFEITAEGLGAQNAIAGGGRYDGLVEEFGGPKTPAFGFAVGVERIVSLMDNSYSEQPDIQVFIISLGEKARKIAFDYAGSLRDSGIKVERDYSNGSLKSQLKKSNRSGAFYSLIIGEDEINRNIVILRNMKISEQEEISQDVVIEEVRKRFEKSDSLA